MQSCLLRMTPDKGEQPVLWPCRRERGRAEVAARAWPTSTAAAPDATPRPVHRHLPHIHNTDPNLVEHALHLVRQARRVLLPACELHRLGVAAWIRKRELGLEHSAC